MVGVAFVAPDVYRKGASVRDYIVLRAGIYDGYGHFYRSEEIGYKRPFVSAEPLHIVHCMIDSVVSFLSGGMARCAVGMSHSVI